MISFHFHRLKLQIQNSIFIFIQTMCMKNRFYLLIAAAVIFSACNKSSSNSQGTFNATINGAAFNNAAFAQKSGTALNIDGAATFYSATPSYPVVIITLGNYTGVGTYTVGGGALNGIAIDSSATSNSSVVIRGQVVITAASPTLTGTFYGTCLDSTKITNGSFSVAAP
jgi:hypothetical protein